MRAPPADAPTPSLNVDPVRQNVAYVYPSAQDAPGGVGRRPATAPGCAGDPPPC